MLRLLCTLILALGGAAACGKVDHAEGGDGSPGDGDGAPPGLQTLTVTVDGEGSVTSEPAGIDCPGSCSANFADGSQVVLSPIPSSSSQLAGWTGDCTGFDVPCSVTMDAGRSVDARFGLHGSHRWVDQIGSTGQDFISNDVVVDPDGNPIIAGEMEQDGGGWNIYVAKFDKVTGTMVWDNLIETAASEYFGGLAVDADGNAYAAMSFNGFEPETIAGVEVTPDLYGNIVVVRLAAADGEIEWVKQWGGDGQDRPHALAVGGANLYVAGETSSSSADFDGTVVPGSIGDAFIVKARLDNGNAVRVKHLDGDYELYSIAAIDTRVAVAGSFRVADTIDAGCSISLNGANATDGLVADFRVSDLDCQWAQDFGDLDADMDAFAFGVAAFPGGGWVATGGFEGDVLFAESGSALSSHGAADVFAVRYAANGDHVWSFRYGDTGSDVGTSIAATPDGYTLFTGAFNSPTITFGGFELEGNNDVFVTRMTPGVAPSHEWAVALGGDDTDRAEGLAVDPTGYVYVLAYFQGMTNVDGENMTAMVYDAWLAGLVR